jgi:hypothetical protein
MNKYKYVKILLLLLSPSVFADIPKEAIRTTDMKDICTTLTSTVRNVPKSLKVLVYKRDKGDLSKTTEYEVDHRIALSSGGSNDISNLKLQSYFGKCNAHHKDVLEVRVHSMVCKQKMTVQKAQDYLYNNWETGYTLFIDKNGCNN